MIHWSNDSTSEILKSNEESYWFMFWISNDVYDFDTGADEDKRESAVNICGRFPYIYWMFSLLVNQILFAYVHVLLMCQEMIIRESQFVGLEFYSRSRVFYMAYICLVIGCGGLLLGGIQAGDVRVVSLLAGAILSGYVYQCPPFRLSYLGLGEPLCFAAFGPLATTAFYFSQSSKSQTATLLFSSTVLCVSLLVGVTTTLILFCSHFHQIDGDHRVGKMSPLVRMGTERGSAVVKYGVVSLYSLLFAFVVVWKALPLTCLLFPLLTLPVGISVIDFVQKNHNDKEKIFMAKYYCVRLHASFGAALAFGLFSAAL